MKDNERVQSTFLSSGTLKADYSRRCCNVGRWSSQLFCKLDSKEVSVLWSDFCPTHELRSVAVAPAAAPATLTPLAGCRAGSVEDIASNPPRAAECRNVRCLASGNQHFGSVSQRGPTCSSGFGWHVGGAFGANVPNARHMTARQCANVLAGGSLDLQPS